MGIESSYDEWSSPKSSQEKDWQELEDLIYKSGAAPGTLTCPTCHQKRFHYFFARANVINPERTSSDDRGGALFWCSRCKVCEHFSGLVPDWWRDVSVPVEALTIPPVWLDANLEQWEPK